ncbi:MAG: hypothetical protein QM673_14005 [Gordonia sp. (in: high G+C Gram-positive bacteria)]
MTRPPDVPHDPRHEQHPHTRAFDAFEEPASASAPTAPTEAYSQQRYQEPFLPAAGAPHEQPSAGRGGGIRTAVLAVTALVAIVAIVVVGYLLLHRSPGAEGDASAASTIPAPASATATTTAPHTPTTTSAEPPIPAPTRTVARGAVVYQITGNGDIVGLRYRTGTHFTLVAAAGTPWSQAVTVRGHNAELTAIVVRGPVTCNILRGEDLLSSSTSSGGLLRCVAVLTQ